MPNRLTRITTGNGDKGYTTIADGQKLSKSSQRIECIGVVDELNAALGMLASSVKSNEILIVCRTIQNYLFEVGGELAYPKKKRINKTAVDYLEKKISQYNQLLPPLKEFVIPGQCFASATAHLVRCIARRSERNLVLLQQQEQISDLLLVFFNRLSDLLFIISRVLAREGANNEPQWKQEVADYEVN